MKTIPPSAPLLVRIGFAVLLIATSASLCRQAFLASPSADESAHLVAGMMIARVGDPGFYRVNPPLHKLLSGLAVDVLFAPELSLIYPASSFSSGSRQEFSSAQTILERNPEGYKEWLWVGRCVRLPFVLGSVLLLLRIGPQLPRQATWISATLYLSSPLILGHGGLITPDAISAVAMTFLIYSTLGWLKTRSILDSVAVGIAWGLALSTKFTFCPIFIAWPIGLVLFEYITKGIDKLEILRLGVAHCLHGLIALLIVIGFYNACDVGVPLDSHQFNSERMRNLAGWLGSIPSPLPKQYLVGIDEQQIDLEQGFPSYFLGQWYPDGAWWFYAVGLLAKEQLVFVASMVAIVAGLLRLACRCWSDNIVAGEERPMLTQATFVFCLFVAALVLLVLSLHSRMALNVRYMMPALPPLCVASGIAWNECRLARPKMVGIFLWLGALTLAVEFLCNATDHYAYANPLFGGSHRVPPVLHDTNFDGGQDLWRLESYLDQTPPPIGFSRQVFVHTSLPTSLINVPRPTIRQDRLDSFVQSKTDQDLDAEYADAMPPLEIIVMRGLGVRAPWTHTPWSIDPQILESLTTLLETEPDEFITPTLAIYRTATEP